MIGPDAAPNRECRLRQVVGKHSNRCPACYPQGPALRLVPAPSKRYVLRCQRCKAHAVVAATEYQATGGDAAFLARVQVEHFGPPRAGRGATLFDLWCCNRTVRVDGLRVKVTDTPCDARCTGAKGFHCECSCGGKNHGSDA